MQAAIARESLNGRDFPMLGTKGGHDTTVHRFAVQYDGASAAVAGITSLFNSEPTQFAQEGPQTLAGPWLRCVLSPVYQIGHGGASPQSSRRISWMCLRQTRLP